MDSGSIYVWIHQSLSGNDKLILNQTPDHYSTVVQIGAYLIENGFTEVNINHRNSVDVEGRLNNESLAFEFERDGTHSMEDIRDKFLNAKKLFDRVYIVSMSTNAKKCIEAVEAPNTRPRGTQLKDLIDNIIKTAKKAETQAVFEPVNEEKKIVTNSQENLKENVTDKEEEQKIKIEKTEAIDVLNDVFLITEEDVVGEALFGTLSKEDKETVLTDLSTLQLKTFKRNLAKTYLEENPELAKGMYYQACKLLGGNPETDLKIEF